MKDGFRGWVIIFACAVLSLTIAILIGQIFFHLSDRSPSMQVLILAVLLVVFWIYFQAVISKLSSRFVFAGKLEQIFASLQTPVDWLSEQSDLFLASSEKYIKNNGVVILSLGVVSLAAYGFELFNLNLTIDEEFHAFLKTPTPLWIGEGRWGMFLLNKFLLPYTTIPVVPLFIGLAFHLMAILLILNSWRVKSKLEQLVCGAILLTFPTLAFIYEFSSLNFGIGIGFFCAGLSLLLYSTNKWANRLFAVFPAGFAIAIYQPFALALAAIFLVYLIIEIRDNRPWFRNLLSIAMILTLAFLFYYLAEKLFLSLSGIRDTPYVSHYFDFSYLFDHFKRVLSTSWKAIIGYYTGSGRIYGMEITALGLLLLVSLAGIILKLMDNGISNKNLVIILLFSLVLLLIPFSGILFSRGKIISRTLLALPVSIAGVFILGLPANPRVVRFSLLMLAAFSVFQFIVSNNRLFSSSYLALEADRLLAVRLMEKIDKAKAISGNPNPFYIDVIGDLVRPEIQPIPRRETFGVSFFELKGTGGQVFRISLFLQISGYQDFEALPESRRIAFVDVANKMPIWPTEGSVRVVDDTVLIKLADYSARQKRMICSLAESDTDGTKLPEGFCR
ncbi:MAG: glucosyltransferase domain-containing protein [Chloroflexi bacterium]|nr:glucosyltransferase domain-containing protein [Chloroflexota bacterium]